ncbi:MJ0042-type zinc finger domain-containing protein [Tistrella bauzanensis]
MSRRGKHRTGPATLQPAPGGAYNRSQGMAQPSSGPRDGRPDPGMSGVSVPACLRATAEPILCMPRFRPISVRSGPAECASCRLHTPRFRAMILTCPACSTRYTLDPQSLGPDGRKVRCTQCGHVWQQDPRRTCRGPCRCRAARIPTSPPPCSTAAMR